MLICALAILKLGAVFVPFDSMIPDERLNLTLAASNAQLLIRADSTVSKEV